MSRALRALSAALLTVGVVVPTLTTTTSASAAGPTIRVGVGVSDATWHVGASAGQYAAETGTAEGQEDIQAEWDPNFQHAAKASSYGIASRLSVRALVVEGTDGTRVALVKNDNYLAQDYLQRRVADLLAAAGSGVTYEHILVSATHNHSSPYYSTPAAGVWLFQDAVDLRMFEYQARATAGAILDAERTLTPAKMGAMLVPFGDVKSNIVRPAEGDDGSPAGYPLDFGDNNITVLRFDSLGGDPIATYVNFGQHPESLDTYNLISGDYIAPLERFVDRETGSTMVFSQADVGSAEGPYDSTEVLADGTRREFAHKGFAQAERGARIIADAVIGGWNAIGAGGGTVPFDSSFPVKMMTRWTPGPASHPYASYGNCRTQPTVDLQPGAGAAPDCERPSNEWPDDSPVPYPTAPLYENLQAAGLPLPANYSQSSFSAVEENNRLKLQVVRLGEVLLASCSCEAQVDLILNLESRIDTAQGNIFDGYDWAAPIPGVANSGCKPAAGGQWTCYRTDGRSTLTVTDAAYQRMKAQVHNDAKGWDAATPEAIAAAETDPADPAAIKGNFTKEELPANLGYTLPVGLGHSGDYAGYTVSYREYMNRDSYRKALTSYGPHTADYMNTRLARMAGYLKGGPALPDEPTHALGVADEQRQAAEAKALGQLSSYYFDGWNAQLADDVGPAAALVQPPLSITRFQSATFTWRGGGNFVDNPTVRVERQLPDGTWEAYADMSGEVQTVLALPDGVTSHATTRAGVQEWEWTANFEAFDGYKRFGRPGTQTPNGNYRFVADGNIRQAGAIEDYTVTSRVFAVGPWTGLVAGDPRLEAGNAVSVPVTEPNYPRTYSSAFLFIKDDGAGANAVCETCAFRPWARSSTPQDVTITVVRDGTVLRRVPATLSGDRWVAPVALQPGELAFVERGMALDEYSEINGAPSKAIGVDGVLVAAPEITSDPEPVVPEVPVPALLLVAAVAIAYGAFRRSRRTP